MVQVNRDFPDHRGGGPTYQDTPADPAAYLPVLPYKRTSGWSGTDTSRERAETEASDGTTGARQRTTLVYLYAAGVEGVTWKELSQAYGWHHGQASAVLSNLHKAHKIARLKTTRDRCKVYVIETYVGGRETEEFQPNKKHQRDWADVLREWAESEHELRLDFQGHPLPERMKRLLKAAFGPDL